METLGAILIIALLGVEVYCVVALYIITEEYFYILTRQQIRKES